MRIFRLQTQAVLVLSLMGLLGGLFSGCAPVHETSTAMPELGAPPPEKIDPGENPGSLFQPSQADYLFADNQIGRAHV